MTREEFEKWLKGAVNDCFMDLFFYDRKNCEEMPSKKLKEAIEKGFLTKRLLTDVFLEQIENEFEQ